MSDELPVQVPGVTKTFNTTLCGYCGDRGPWSRWGHDPCWLLNKLEAEKLAPSPFQT